MVKGIGVSPSRTMPQPRTSSTIVLAALHRQLPFAPTADSDYLHRQLDRQVFVNVMQVASLCTRGSEEVLPYSPCLHGTALSSCPAPLSALLTL